MIRRSFGTSTRPRLNLVKSDDDAAALHAVADGVAADLAAGIPADDIMVVTLPEP